jgi:hypothetical protein
VVPQAWLSLPGPSVVAYSAAQVSHLDTSDG